MDYENASCAHDDEECAQLSLLHLPVEVFLHICSFLDASTLHSLSSVCKQCYLVLNDADSLWKVRLNHILWPYNTHSLICPARPNKLFWKLSCVAIEKQTALWKQPDSMEKLMLRQGHYSAIRAVLLMHVDGITYLVSKKSGILAYQKLSYPVERLYKVRDYLDSVPSDCLMAIDHTIYVCSCYNIIKSWVLTNKGLVQDRTYNIERNDRNRKDILTCMSSCPERALFATGSKYGIINMFDSRSSNKPIRQLYWPHSVRNLTMNTKYILSASENTVSVWDQRADRIVKSITILGNIAAYITCMSMRRDWVCVGDETKLHMLDPTNDFELVKSCSTEHTVTISGVRLTHGCLITSSWDGTVRISSPTDPPKHIATLCPEIGYIAHMDYLNDTLAIAGNNSVVVWRPRNQRV